MVVLSVVLDMRGHSGNCYFLLGRGRSRDAHSVPTGDVRSGELGGGWGVANSCVSGVLTIEARGRGASLTQHQENFSQKSLIYF